MGRLRASVVGKPLLRSYLERHQRRLHLQHGQKVTQRISTNLERLRVIGTELVFVDSFGHKWTLGAKMWIGWPHLAQRQLRVCLGVRQMTRLKWVGFFARVERGDVTIVGRQTKADKPLIPLWFTPGVLEVPKKATISSDSTCDYF